MNCIYSFWWKSRKTGLSFGLIACLVWTVEARAVQISGVVTDGSNPIPGARVRLHGATTFEVTDSQGRFMLTTPGEAVAAIVIAAGKEGWINGGVKISPKVSYATIVLKKVPDVDDPHYTFITPH